jgi:outer membrane protein OmpA-like peptidoglycan-associated protein
VEEALVGFGITRDRIIEVRAFGEIDPVSTTDVQQSWRDQNRRTGDQGQWWNRRVVITSTELGGMTGCREP